MSSAPSRKREAPPLTLALYRAHGSGTNARQTCGQRSRFTLISQRQRSPQAAASLGTRAASNASHDTGAASALERVELDRLDVCVHHLLHKLSPERKATTSSNITRYLLSTGWFTLLKFQLILLSSLEATKITNEYVKNNLLFRLASAPLYLVCTMIIGSSNLQVRAGT